MLQPTSRCSYVLAIEKAISCQTESVHLQVMTKKPTSTDVATLAQVSRSAVSLVLSGRASAARLSSDTVERVLKAAEALHYRPNASGRSLVRGKTDTIGLIIRDLDLLDVDPVLSLLLSGIVHRCRAGGYQVLVETARGNGEGDPFGELMDSGRIDGMIVENADYADPSLRRLIQSGRPVVVFGSQGLDEENAVGGGEHRTGEMVTEHLMARGRRRIAHITYSSEGIFSVDQRLAGYRAALATAGVVADPRLVVHANFSMESGYRAMQQLLALAEPPDAVFIGSDAVAIGAMAAITDAGLSVPADIAVASVDDIEMARFCRPALTSVPINARQSGAEAASMLIDMMEGKKPEPKRPGPGPQLIVRASSG